MCTTKDVGFRICPLKSEDERKFFELLAANVDSKHYPAPSNPFRSEKKCLVSESTGTVICALQGLGINILPTLYLVIQDSSLSLIQVAWQPDPVANVIKATGNFLVNSEMSIEYLRQGLAVGGRHLTGSTPELAHLCNISNEI